MSERTVEVDYENCRQIAGDLVFRLKGRTFSVSSSRTNISPRPAPKTISGLRLYDESRIPDFDPMIGYHFDNGILTIPLSPRRKLQWDVKIEKVFVTFHEDGNITIEKSLFHGFSSSLIIRF